MRVPFLVAAESSAMAGPGPRPVCIRLVLMGQYLPAQSYVFLMYFSCIYHVFIILYFLLSCNLVWVYVVYVYVII